MIIIYKNLIDISKKLSCTVLLNESMKKHTSFKIGGDADVFIYVNNIESLKIILGLITTENIPYFIIGNGTNLLVSDDGFRGIVLNLQHGLKNIEINKEENTIYCEAGVPLNKVCVCALQNNLSGLEFAWGIPGTCGGALSMNAGAYGSDISNVIESSKHLTPSGTTETLSKNELNLSYRKSIFSFIPFIISSMKFKLHKANEKDIRAKMYENISKRKSKQPLEYPNAGSIFKRPKGYFAGALIEQSGFKGKFVGGAMVSPKHSGFIINTGKATASDVSNLIYLIKDKVYKEFGVILECEIKTLGNVNL